MVLLLALLILATILVTSLTVGSIVLRQLKVTTSTDRGIVAYYAAESGLEQGLYLWRQEGQKGNALQVTSANPVALAASRSFWWRDGQETESAYAATLKQNQTVQLDLFDPTLSLDSQTKAQSIKIGWEAAAGGCPGQGSEWLEVSWSNWGGAGSALDVQRRFVNHSQIVSSPGQAIIININNASQPSLVNYRLRLKALYADICNLTLTAYRGTGGEGEVYNLPARLTISATGQLLDTQQALSVTVPQFAPQLGLFDYTVFSQCSVLKGNLTENCP